MLEGDISRLVAQLQQQPRGTEPLGEDSPGWGCAGWRAQRLQHQLWPVGLPLEVTSLRKKRESASEDIESASPMSVSLQGTLGILHASPHRARSARRAGGRGA